MTPRAAGAASLGTSISRVSASVSTSVLMAITPGLGSRSSLGKWGQDGLERWRHRAAGPVSWPMAARPSTWSSRHLRQSFS